MGPKWGPKCAKVSDNFLAKFRSHPVVIQRNMKLATSFLEIVRKELGMATFLLGAAICFLSGRVFSDLLGLAYLWEKKQRSVCSKFLAEIHWMEGVKASFGRTSAVWNVGTGSDGTVVLF